MMERKHIRKSIFHRGFWGVIFFSFVFFLSCMCFAAPAKADSGNGMQYTFTIPSVVEINAYGSGSMTVTASATEDIGTDAVLDITITGSANYNEGFNLVNLTGNDSIPYIITLGETAIGMNDSILNADRMALISGECSDTLYFNIEGTALYADTYTDTLSFTVSFSDPSVQETGDEEQPNLQQMKNDTKTESTGIDGDEKMSAVEGNDPGKTNVLTEESGSESKGAEGEPESIGDGSDSGKETSGEEGGPESSGDGSDSGKGTSGEEGEPESSENGSDLGKEASGTELNEETENIPDVGDNTENNK